MSTLKEVKERERLIFETIKKVEGYLDCRNGMWNNVIKMYQFEIGERLHIEHIMLSEKVMFHIASLC